MGQGKSWAGVGHPGDGRNDGSRTFKGEGYKRGWGSPRPRPGALTLGRRLEQSRGNGAVLKDGPRLQTSVWRARTQGPAFSTECEPQSRDPPPALSAPGPAQASPKPRPNPAQTPPPSLHCSPPQARVPAPP